jgi:hypothetical protein
MVSMPSMLSGVCDVLNGDLENAKLTCLYALGAGRAYARIPSKRACVWMLVSVAPSSPHEGRRARGFGMMSADGRLTRQSVCQPRSSTPLQ